MLNTIVKEDVNPYRVLNNHIINQLQVIIGSMEQHEPKSALNACKKIKAIADEIRLEILGINGGR